MRERIAWGVAFALAVALGAVLVQGGRKRSDVSSSRAVNQGASTRRVTPGSPGLSAKVQLRLLRRCSAQLRLARALLEAQRRPHSRPNRSDSPRLAACRKLPGFARLVRVAIADQLSQTSSEPRNRSDVDARHQSIASRLLGQLLQLDPDESSWVSDYVCQVRKLRQHAIHSLGDDETDLERSLATIQADRKAVLQDLRDYLGSTKYERLRQIGGLGLLGDVLDCSTSGAPPAQ